MLDLPEEVRNGPQGEAILDVLEKGATATQDICAGTGIEPSTITPGEDTSSDQEG